MFQLKNHQFSPSPIPTLATLIICPFLIFLGVWQLNRADEKREIDNGVLQAQNKQALNLNDVTANSILNEIYRSATLSGRFDNQHQYLRDNRTHQGKPGYHVLTPLVLIGQNESGIKKAVLVNRGWIPYLGTRENIPDIHVTDNTITLEGVIKKAGRSIVLKKDVSETDISYPHLVQEISLSNFGKALSYDFLPIIIELNKSEQHGFVRDWQPYYGSVDKHLAYALQWFVMAAILFFLYVKMNTKKFKS